MLDSTCDLEIVGLNMFDLKQISGPAPKIRKLCFTVVFCCNKKPVFASFVWILKQMETVFLLLCSFCSLFSTTLDHLSTNSLTEVRLSFCYRVNSFTSPARKNSGPKAARTRLQTVYFQFITHLLSVLCVLIKSFHMAVRKRKRKGLRVLNFALLLLVFK